MNEHDSERISYILENMGYHETDDIQKANFIIYNTCIVRENAELKVYGHLGALKAMKRKDPDLIIAVCGCMMQIEEAREEIKNKYKHVDIIFSTKSISSLPYLLHDYDLNRALVIDVEDTDDIDEETSAIRRNKSQAYINIMYGCNNFCSYCIVPYTRGREESRKVETILSEISLLAKQGYKEVTLLGQNVNSYGQDLQPCITFAQLLYRVNQINGLERIRFMTSHPKDVSDELIQSIKSLDKVCENIHLPVQSGSDRILSAMNRKYTRNEYLEKIRKVRESSPDITLSTDIIVGFPGETEEDFLETISLVKEVQYDQAYIFMYSKRTGTGAARMQEQVPEAIKNERFQRLLKIMNDIFFEKNKHYIGKTVCVLAEGKSKNNEGILSGRTRNNKLVHFPADVELIGKFVDVKIKAHTSFTLEGEVERVHPE